MNKLNIRSLSPELLKIATDELNEDPKSMSENVENLKKWINETPHLKARTNDQFLVNFLRGAKYNEDKAKSKIETFYTVRTQSPELMSNRDPHDERVKEIIKIGYVFLIDCKKKF